MASWKRTYWAIFAANLVTAVGMMSFLPFFPSYLHAMGVEDPHAVSVWAGVLFGAAPLAAAVMGPVWGSIGDRFGRKAMVLRALLAITLFVGAMAFARDPWELLALRLGQGVFSGFVPPSITLVSVAAPAGAQGRVAGSLSSALAAGSILGPLLGALVQSTLGIRAVFGVVSLASGLGAALVAYFAEEDASLRDTLASWSPAGFFGDVLGDLRAVLANARMRAAVVLLFCVQFGIGATNPLLELYVDRSFGGTPATVASRTAWLFTAFAASALVAMPRWGRLGDRIGHGRALLRSGLGTAVALAAHAFVPVYGLLLVTRVLLGLVSSGTNANAFGVAARETAVERRGSAFGAVFSARALAMSMGAMSGGALATALGIRGLFLAAAGLLLALLVPLAVLGRLRQRSQDVAGVDADTRIR